METIILTILIVLLFALDIFCIWMIWRLNIYVAKLEKTIEENQELTENLFISLKSVVAEGMILPDGTMKKVIIQQ